MKNFYFDPSVPKQTVAALYRAQPASGSDAYGANLERARAFCRQVLPDFEPPAGHAEWCVYLWEAEHAAYYACLGFNDYSGWWFSIGRLH
jgi:hypothetical protein